MELETIIQPPVLAPQSDLQADEGSGRPSGEENTDRLQETEERTPLSAAAYDGVKLPEALKDHQETFASFKRLAAELQLSPEAAQKLVEWENACAVQGRKTADAERSEILERWTEQTRELFGPAYQKNVTQALAAAERFGGPELLGLLEATGLGSHPAVVQAFYEINRQTSEDISVGGSVRSSADKTFAEALYGTSV